MSQINKTLEYEGEEFLRMRLVLSCLSGRRLILTDVRSQEFQQGFKDYEQSMIQLLTKIMNGGSVKPHSTGLNFTPGMLSGGTFEHSCCPSRGIGYYLKPLMMLAMFCKHPIRATLRGLTNHPKDLGVEQFKFSHISLLKKLAGAFADQVDLKINKRGLPGGTGEPQGEVVFTCCVVQKIPAFQWEEAGVVARVRGVVYTRRLAPEAGNAIIKGLRVGLVPHLHDVYFHQDSRRQPGAAAGFGVALQCITDKGTVYSKEVFSGSLPHTITQDARRRVLSEEQVASEAVSQALEEVYRGGVVDTAATPLLLLLMALAPRGDVCSAVLGWLAPDAKAMLLHLHHFLGVKFHPKAQPSPVPDTFPSIKLTCVGVGFVNVNRGRI